MNFKYDDSNMNFLKGKDFLKLLDFTPCEIYSLIELAEELKAKKNVALRTMPTTAKT